MKKIGPPPLSTPLPRWDLRACKNMDPEIFYEDDDRNADVPNVQAEWACRTCEIQPQCLAWAMEHERHGVWGGLTQRQREKLKRGVERVSCPGCFGTNILEEPGTETCIGCGLSWKI